MEIGRLIRAGWHSTSIGRYQLRPDSASEPVLRRELTSGQCLSAATLIYLGGRLRYFPEASKFGVHQFSYKNPSPENLFLSQALSAKISNYIAEMGVSLKFLEVSTATPNDKMDLIDVSELRKLGVVTDGQTNVHWSVQAKNSTLYVRGERDSLYGHHKVILGYSKAFGFYFWAVIEAQGREQELTSFGLVEIVLNGEASRVDISARCERAVYGIYVNIIAKLTTKEARSIAFSDSFGVQVRFSDEAEMFLGVSAVSTDGGREELATFFNTLFDDPP